MTIEDLVYIDETGYHFADYPAFLAWRQEGYRAIYGADIYLESDSQDGQLIAIQAKADYDTAALGAATFNSFSPVTAQGVGLARNVKINGINKRSATYSTADLTIVGQAGTILNGAIAVDTLDQKWLIPNGTTIPGGGTVVATATAEKIGAVAAEASTINRIYTPTLGWQTVNNVAAATPGVPVESDAELRTRQASSTANPSLTVFEGSVGAVQNLPGVIACRGYENDSDVTDPNGIAPHSISHMVIGGDSTEIAQTIALHKTPGTGTVGTTMVPVTDSKGMPLDIRFTRPTAAIIGVEITLAAGVGWSSEFEDLIAAAVAETINDFGIGNNVLITRLFAPAYLVGTPAGETFDIATIRIKKDAGSFGTSNITIDFDEYPSCDPALNFTFIVT
ncbi:XkdT Uncharacterized homolog of phage Mu protein gp47 [uncultured Caudovirales phage]|uniref:XkdT Uncharacterized homolog of phage Mu protein gp47 n=1 Tax=uncultured Caudovirales phage TaxID=2100421 RepID=A0A6J5MVT6_9CAUD|nr:XkdT Uncharacterized homolog of phage Mu protein gp47 [uncultured Caudovirales phage]